eukprot:TRINITY_DN9807_c0_g1_i10.p2 TRINITY_DN9807_c0_g1~~TRINITY_DN9807_c0_g1_i10.p2  ORF type:complete len:128 (-),score=75.24 TRINITY_DN9807_c0_g1_i10:248-574(-)
MGFTQSGDYMVLTPSSLESIRAFQQEAAQLDEEEKQAIEAERQRVIAETQQRYLEAQEAQKKKREALKQQIQVTKQEHASEYKPSVCSKANQLAFGSKGNVVVRAKGG